MNELRKEKEIVLCLSLANKTEFAFYESLFWDVWNWDSCNAEILLNIHYHVRGYLVLLKALSELKAEDNTVEYERDEE